MGSIIIRLLVLSISLFSIVSSYAYLEMTKKDEHHSPIKYETKNTLIILLLIGIGGLISSCTKKKNDLDITGEQAISMSKPKALPQLDTAKAIPPRFGSMDKAMWTTLVDSCTIPIDINGLEVGRPVSLFSTIGCGKLTGCEGSYIFYTNNNPRVNVFDIQTDKKGIITRISFLTYDNYALDEEECGYAI